MKKKSTLTIKRKGNYVASRIQGRHEKIFGNLFAKDIFDHVIESALCKHFINSTEITFSSH